ncbi:sporulation protein YabP [Clostridium sp.]|uniref:sporulation protein YabP n=1 Tax=Clostridium sp. TaxID=1506 RepID=UPI002FCB3979
MEQSKEVKVENKRSFLSLENRKKMNLDGVTEIVSFNDEQILLKTVLGNMDIRGEELKMNKLDVQNGDVVISGNITYIVYTSEEKKQRKHNGIIARLFR